MLDTECKKEELQLRLLSLLEQRLEKEKQTLEKKECELEIIKLDNLKKIIKRYQDNEAFKVKKLRLSNSEKIRYLHESNLKIRTMLEVLAPLLPIDYNIDGDWINVNYHDSNSCFELPLLQKNQRVKRESLLGKLGITSYQSIVDYLSKEMISEIIKYNNELTMTQKGIAGEENVKRSLKVLETKYKVLHNIRISAQLDDEEYFSETDTYVITPHRIYIIETKNIGGKDDVIKVTADGKWEKIDRKNNRVTNIKSPSKQVTEHVFLTEKFLKDNGITEEIAFTPVISIADENVKLDIDSKVITPILRASELGTFIFNKSSGERETSNDLMQKICDIFERNNLGENAYFVRDYYRKIFLLSRDLLKILEAYQKDLSIENELKRQYEENKKREREEKELAERQRRIAEEKEIERKEKEKKFEENLETGMKLFAIFCDWLFG